MVQGPSVSSLKSKLKALRNVTNTCLQPGAEGTNAKSSFQALGQTPQGPTPLPAARPSSGKSLTSSGPQTLLSNSRLVAVAESVSQATCAQDVECSLGCPASAYVARYCSSRGFSCKPGCLARVLPAGSAACAPCTSHSSTVPVHLTSPNLHSRRDETEENDRVGWRQHDLPVVTLSPTGRAELFDAVAHGRSPVLTGSPVLAAAWATRPEGTSVPATDTAGDQVLEDASSDQGENAASAVILRPQPIEHGGSRGERKALCIQAAVARSCVAAAQEANGREEEQEDTWWECDFCSKAFESLDMASGKNSQMLARQ
jgi:hypothetical protein